MSDEATRFLNVDLDVESPSDLLPFVDALTPGAFALHVGESQEGVHRARLELATQPSDADIAIRELSALVRALPTALRQRWDEATVRDFNIGVQAGPTPYYFALPLEVDTVQAAAELGARIVVTVYAASPVSAASSGGATV